MELQMSEFDERGYFVKENEPAYFALDKTAD